MKRENRYPSKSKFPKTEIPQSQKSPKKMKRFKETLQDVVMVLVVVVFLLLLLLLL